MNHRFLHTHTKRPTAVLLTVFLLSVLVLSACGGSSDEASSGSSVDDLTLDVQQLASDLRSELVFQDDLEAVEPAVFSMLYGLDETAADEAALFAGTGATAEEIAVIHAASADQVDAVVDAVQQRIQSQRDGFENYVPEELTKLEQPVMVQAGQYVILVISDDNDAAKNAIDAHLTGE